MKRHIRTGIREKGRDACAMGANGAAIRMGRHVSRRENAAEPAGETAPGYSPCGAACEPAADTRRTAPGAPKKAGICTRPADAYRMAIMPGTAKETQERTRRKDGAGAEAGIRMRGLLPAAAAPSF